MHSCALYVVVAPGGINDAYGALVDVIMQLVADRRDAGPCCSLSDAAYTITSLWTCLVVKLHGMHPGQVLCLQRAMGSPQLVCSYLVQASYLALTFCKPLTFYKL